MRYFWDIHACNLFETGHIEFSSVSTAWLKLVRQACKRGGGFFGTEKVCHCSSSSECHRSAQAAEAQPTAWNEETVEMRAHLDASERT